jgi:hypothetical protein
MRTVVLAVALALLACGDSGSSKPDGSVKSDGGGCPSAAGQYTITKHCTAALVGSSVTVSQSGCSITKVDPWTGWTGTVGADGSMTMSGPGASTNMSCTATLSGTTYNLTCNPTCDVALQKK